MTLLSDRRTRDIYPLSARPDLKVRKQRNIPFEQLLRVTTCFPQLVFFPSPRGVRRRRRRPKRKDATFHFARFSLRRGVEWTPDQPTQPEPLFFLSFLIMGGGGNGGGRRWSKPSFLTIVFLWVKSPFLFPRKGEGGIDGKTE